MNAPGRTQISYPHQRRIVSTRVHGDPAASSDPNSRVVLTPEEEIEAEESLTVYCKPVELYNIIQRRAVNKPLFLQRCLKYKLEEKNKRRIKMTVSLNGAGSDGLQGQRVHPLYVMLAKRIPDSAVPESSALYQFSRASLLTDSSGFVPSTPAQAHLILPEMNKLLLEAKSGSYCLLLISSAGTQNYSCTFDQVANNYFDTSSFSQSGGRYCLSGRILLESLCDSWEQSPNLNLRQRVMVSTTVDLHSCFVKMSCLDGDKFVSLEITQNPENVTRMEHVHVAVSVEEVGALERSPYNVYACSDNPTSSSEIAQLRAGNVIFNYRYYHNKLQRTEVTEDFTCPFCLVKCASFKGLRYHLTSSHDLFNFEFWVTEQYQSVNVSVKPDVQRPECAARVDPKMQIFFFGSKRQRQNKPSSLVQKSKHVHPVVVELPTGLGVLLDKAEGVSGSLGKSHVDSECVQAVSGNNLVPSGVLQFAKTRKLSADRPDQRSSSLLRKRQFFHSHRAQPMAVEQVFSDRDSEDEVDDDVADLEDRRMLDDFVDVTAEEKKIMHMWNSFVRKQRVLADNHIPWACEAFSRLHGRELVQVPNILWCWRLLMIKLWNHGLLDARTMDNCTIILEGFKNQDPSSSKPKN